MYITIIVGFIFLVFFMQLYIYVVLSLDQTTNILYMPGKKKLPFLEHFLALFKNLSDI